MENKVQSYTKDLNQATVEKALIKYVTEQADLDAGMKHNREVLSVVIEDDDFGAIAHIMYRDTRIEGEDPQYS